MLILSEPQTAPRYDGKTRSFLVDANGGLKSVHPVDHKFALGLCTKRGSWKSSPTIGNDLFRIEYLGIENMQAEVERCVLTAEPCATLIANGDVSIALIEHEQTPEGFLLVSVDYVNLRLDKNKILRATNYP